MASSINDKITRASNGTTAPLPTTLSALKASGATTATLAAATGWPTTTAVYFALYQVSSVDGTEIAGTRTIWKATLSGTTLSNMTLHSGTEPAAGYAIGSVVEPMFTSGQLDDWYAGYTAEHNQLDGKHIASLPLTTPKITTSINDANGNEVIKTPATSSAVNEITVTNAATGNSPTISVTGDDSNIDLTFASKGTGKLKGVVNNLFSPYKFSVYRNAAHNSSNSPAVVLFDTKTFDTGTNVDVVTNKGRFTAPIAGFYWFAACAGNTAASATPIFAYLYKNGSVLKRGSGASSAAGGTCSMVSGLVSLAASDYVEVYFIGGSGSTMEVGSDKCWFDGELRSAT